MTDQPPPAWAMEEARRYAKLAIATSDYAMILARALADTRRAAIEEAARRLDAYPGKLGSKWCASVIRALIDQPPAK